MRCRDIKNGNVVWFGSVGKTEDGKAIFARQDKLNFVDKQHSVVASLTQRLSVLRTELWYRINYGLPLFEKVKNKAFIDAVVLDIVTSYEDVTSIASFTSTLTNHEYKCTIEVQSKYGNLTISL